MNVIQRTAQHIITCEYPPQFGGVGSYVATLAPALAATGQQVHVWCPPAEGERPAVGGVTVHAETGAFSRADLHRLNGLLDAQPGPRRLLVQWVPHGYGYRSMNLGFCQWVNGRAQKGDAVDLMVHEPFLAFAGSWKQRGAAAVHRVMTKVMLGAATRVWISTPAWKTMLEPFAPKRDLGFEWLPIPSPVAPVDDPDGVARLRSGYLAHGTTRLVGHLGMYSRLTATSVHRVMSAMLAADARMSALLIGMGSDELRREILQGSPVLKDRIHNALNLTPDDLSRHLQTCDVFIQPYPEGLTSRRTSTMGPLAHGRAVVSFDGEATESIWREQGGVALVPAGDTGAMTREALHLVTDARARAALAAKGRALYDTRFDVRHTVDALMAVACA
jgi:glycosyltransferase involved in cell wall biosynthesis